MIKAVVKAARQRTRPGAACELRLNFVTAFSSCSTVSRLTASLLTDLFDHLYSIDLFDWPNSPVLDAAQQLDRSLEHRAIAIMSRLAKNAPD